MTSHSDDRLAQLARDVRPPDAPAPLQPYPAEGIICWAERIMREAVKPPRRQRRCKVSTKKRVMGPLSCF